MLYLEKKHIQTIKTKFIKFCILIPDFCSCLNQFISFFTEDPHDKLMLLMFGLQTMKRDMLLPHDDLI